MPEDIELGEIRRRVLAAFKEGRLHSYDRHTPSGGALQALALARKQAGEWIAIYGESPDSLRLLALIQESLTHYSSAIKTLERLVELKSASRDDLKRLAHCRVALQEETLKNQERIDDD